LLDRRRLAASRASVLGACCATCPITHSSASIGANVGIERVMIAWLPQQIYERLYASSL